MVKTAAHLYTRIVIWSHGVTLFWRMIQHTFRRKLFPYLNLTPTDDGLLQWNLHSSGSQLRLKRAFKLRQMHVHVEEHIIADTVTDYSKRRIDSLECDVSLEWNVRVESLISITESLLSAYFMYGWKKINLCRYHWFPTVIEIFSVRLRASQFNNFPWIARFRQFPTQRWPQGRTAVNERIGWIKRCALPLSIKARML